MGIKQFNLSFTGETGVTPRLGHLSSSDSRSVIQSPGYINPYIKMNGVAIYPTDIIFISGSDGLNGCIPVFNGEVITLSNLF